MRNSDVLTFVGLVYIFSFLQGFFNVLLLSY